MMDTDTLLDAVAEIVQEQVADLRRDAERQIAEAHAAADAARQRAEKLAEDLKAAEELALEQRAPEVTEADTRRVVQEVVSGTQAWLAERVDASLQDEKAAWQGRFDELTALMDEKLAALEARPTPMTNDAVRRCAREAAAEAEVRAGEAAEAAVHDLSMRLDALIEQVAGIETDAEQRALTHALEMEELSKHLQGVRADLPEISKAVDAAAAREDVEGSLDAFQVRIGDIEKQFAEKVREIATAQEQIKVTNDEVVAKAITQMRSAVQGAEPWKRGGAGYQKFSVVRHRGALWQSPVETGEEPGRGDDWALLADGVSDVSTSVDDSGVFTLAIKTASGQENAAQFQLPKVNFVGVYDKTATYKKWDAMIRDGHTFLALKDDPGEVGIDNGGWMTIGYRGKAGKRGPTLEETCDELRPDVVRTLMGEMPEMVSTAVQALTETS